MAQKAALVDAVKNLQRADPEIKQAWWDLCEKDLGGVKDPNRHEESVLENFLSMYGGGDAGASAPARPARAAQPRRQAAMSPIVPQFGGGGFGGFGGKGMVGPGRFGGKGMQGGMAMGGGMGMGGGMAMGGPTDMVSWIKTGQKTSGAFKAGWQTYCSMYGGGINDPSRHDPSYMGEFVNYLGQLAQADLGAAAAQAGFPMGMQMQQQHMGGMGGGQKRPMYGNGGGGEPPRKKAAVVDSDPEKAALVDRVKGLQRRDEDTKAAWWAFCDEQHGGVRDPNRHEKEVLEEFLSQYE